MREESVNSEQQAESQRDGVSISETNRGGERSQDEMIVVPATMNNVEERREVEMQMCEDLTISQAQMETVSTTTGMNTGNLVEEVVQNQAQAVIVPPIPRTTMNESQSQVRTTNGSAQRKRSRLGEEGTHSSSASLTKLHECVNAIDFHIENLQRNGAKANTATARAQLAESARGVLVESSNLMIKILSGQEIQICYQKAERAMRDRITTLQEENMGLKQQIIELQTREMSNKTEEKNIPISYMGAAIKNLGSRINEGRQLPIPNIAESIKHAPSECIIIFKAERKGEMLTKSEQEKFRKELKETIGAESMHLISAIRPTRFGGHTMIFQSETQRDEIFEKLKRKEKEDNISDEQSNMIAPKRKVAKAVCKEPPNDISIEGIKKDMYGRHNPALELVPQIYRVGNIIRTRLGLVFEFSSAEMQAVQVQNWRIRCDMGREIKVEEFIPLQQCYACCKFGHNAEECKAQSEACRLCGTEGHSGKNCPHKDDKERWRCINCKRMNASKNLQLDEKHAAAQLHKCPIAQQQKAVKKMQLSASGIYTTPIIKGSDKIENSVPTINKNSQQQNGGRISNFNRGTEIGKFINNKSRSKSKQRFMPLSSTSSSITKVNTESRKPSSTASIFSSTRSFSTSSSSSSSIRIFGQETNENPCVQRSTKVTRPPTADGWQTVEKRGGGKKSWESDRGRDSAGQVGVNSSSSMIIEEKVGTMTPSQTEDIICDE